MQRLLGIPILLAVLRCGEDAPGTPPVAVDVFDATGIEVATPTDTVDAPDVVEVPDVTLPDGFSTCKVPADCKVGQCEQPTCVGGVCGPPEPKPDGVGCDDGDACTGPDGCQAGACKGAPVSCDDGKPCTQDACDPVAGCSSTPSPNAACEDGNPCTENDHCNATGLKCQGGPNTCTEICGNKADDDLNGQIDCGDTQCAADPACLGECEATQAISCGDTVTIDLGAGDKVLEDWPCSDVAWPGPATTVSFLEPESQKVTASLVDPANGVTLLRVADPNGLGCKTSLCVAEAAPSIAFDTVAGATSYFVVETEAALAGTVELQLDCQACVPNCAGKVCGDDGCGGVCGTCVAGSACLPKGVCKPTTIATCNTPLVVGALPYIKQGVTSGAADSVSLPPDSGCAGEGVLGLGAGAGDTVTRFTPPADGQYLISLDADFDASVYILNPCEPAKAADDCVLAQNAPGNGGEKLIATLTGLKDYYVIVDGFGAGAHGSYTLTINQWPCSGSCTNKLCGTDGCEGTCGICDSGYECTETGQCGLIQVNDTCAEALPVGPLPWTTKGDTSAAKDDSMTYAFYCKGAPDQPATAGPLKDQGDGAPDVAYSFVAPKNGKFRATLTASFEGVLSLRSACIDKSPTDCQAALAGPGPLAIDFVLSKGQSLFLVMDGSTKGAAGLFTLVVEEVACTPKCAGKQCGNDACGGECGLCGSGSRCSCDEVCVAIPANDTCETALVIDALPFAYVGETGGAADDYSMAPAVACNGGPAGATYGTGRDVVFKYTAPASQSVTFHFDLAANPPANFNTYLYAVEDCDDMAQGVCIMAADSPANGKESVVVKDMTAGQTVYVVVDGWKAPNCGQFTFQAEVF